MRNVDDGLLYILMVIFGWESFEMLDTYKASIGAVISYCGDGGLHPFKFKGFSGLPSLSCRESYDLFSSGNLCDTGDRLS